LKTLFHTVYSCHPDVSQQIDNNESFCSVLLIQNFIPFLSVCLFLVTAYAPSEAHVKLINQLIN